VLALTVAVVTPLSAQDESQQEPFLNKPVSPKQSIRFYKANRQLQADRISLTGGDASASGCQNMLRKSRVYQALQIGFAFCALYEEKNCAIGSLVPVQSEKQKHSTYILTEGVGWYPEGDDERGIKVASWNCGMTLATGEMRAEHELARQEIKRLRKQERMAKRALEEAQAAYNQARKSVNSIRQYSKRAKAEAIAIGAIEAPEAEQKDNDNEATE
jgi:hypothetical protein